MRKMNIPGTDLYPTSISLGTADYGGTVSPEASVEMLDLYIECGGNFIDTAHCYNNWIPGEKCRSEKIIGKWLKERKLRDKVVLVTKGMHPEFETMHIPRSSKREVLQDVEESLEYLNTDRIDLYFLHRDDVKRPVGEIMDMMNEIADSGKIRYFGCSQWRLPRMKEAEAYASKHKLKGFVANQILWNMAIPRMDPDICPLMDEDTKKYHLERNIAVMAFESQARGFFSKTHKGLEMPGTYKERYYHEENLGRLKRAEKLAQELSCTVTDIAVSYLISQKIVTFPIVGCSNASQLKESLKADEIVLTPDMLNYIDNGN